MPAHKVRIPDHVLNASIQGLRHGVPVTTIALQHGFNYQTLSRALRHHPDAYQARCDYLTNSHLARDGKKNAFLTRRRLERLVTYRRIHGLGPNPPQPRKNRQTTNSIAIAATELSTQPVDNKGKAVG
jgi:hypothetical protein